MTSPLMCQSQVIPEDDQDGVLNLQTTEKTNSDLTWYMICFTFLVRLKEKYEPNWNFHRDGRQANIHVIRETKVGGIWMFSRIHFEASFIF